MTEESREVARKRDEARLLMERALDLLDETAAPAEIGAHLDLAICCLRSVQAQTLTEGAPAKSIEQQLPKDSCAWPLSHAPSAISRSGDHRTDRPAV